MRRLALVIALTSALTLVPATAQAPGLPTPDFAAYDAERDLMPYLSLCAEQMRRVMGGQTEDVIEETARALPTVQGNRLRDVCISFFLGAIVHQRLTVETAARPTRI